MLRDAFRGVVTAGENMVIKERKYGSHYNSLISKGAA